MAEKTLDELFQEIRYIDDKISSLESRKNELIREVESKHLPAGLRISRWDD